jgi:hypothetical protein
MLSVLGGVLTRKAQLIRLDLKSIRKSDGWKAEQTLTAREHHAIRKLPPPEALDLLTTRSSALILGRTSSIPKVGVQESQKKQSE